MAHRSGDLGLVEAGRHGDHAERQGGDDRDARREPVEAVDEVDAVDHAHDPEDREEDGERRREDDEAAAEGVVDDADGHAADDRHAGQHELEDELPAGPELDHVLEEAEAHGQGRATEEHGQLRPGVNEPSESGMLSVVGQRPAGPGRRAGRRRRPRGRRHAGWVAHGRAARAGRSTAPRRLAMRPASGVQEIGDERGGGEADEDVRERLGGGLAHDPRRWVRAGIRRRSGRGPGSARRSHPPRPPRRPGRPGRHDRGWRAR